MQKKIQNNYYQWDISKGDYKIDFESTLTYEKLLRRKILLRKFLRLSGIAGLTILIITVFAYLVS
jgi:hypothetical protein